MWVRKIARADSTSKIRLFKLVSVVRSSSPSLVNMLEKSTEMRYTPNETNIEIAGGKYPTQETKSSKSGKIRSKCRSDHQDGWEETTYG